MTDGERIDPYAQPVYAAPVLGAPLPPPARVPRGPRGLGLGALIMAVAVIVGTAIASAILGSAEAQFATPQDGGYTYNLWLPNSPGDQAIGIWTLVQYGLGTVLGVWSIVQGIRAIAKNRGRLFGILAIIVALAGPAVSFFVAIFSAFAHLPK
jgi:hypothetical protein